MKKIAEIKGEIIKKCKKGEGSDYREEITIKISEDDDNCDGVKFLIDGKEVFIDIDELEQVVDLFR